MTLDFASLNQLSRRDLESLFEKSEAGIIPAGDMHGQWLALPGTTLGRILGRSSTLVWRGKHFLPSQGVIKNMMSPRPFRIFTGDLRVDASKIDGRPAIIVDYQEHHWRGTPLRDEIRQVGDGVYLGCGVNPDGKQTVFFALSSKPISPRRADRYFAGKTAVVTGGGSGFGRCLCNELAARGATVWVADLDLEGATDTVKTIRANGGIAFAEQVDVTSYESVQNLVDRSSKESQSIDLFFNNAGISISGEFRDISFENKRRIMDVNVLGVMNGTQAIYPLMLEQGHGQIVNTGSISGFIPTPMGSMYASSKHAVVGLSTSLRAEAAGLGVKVNVICPGAMETPFFAEGEVVNFNLEEMNNQPVLKRRASPEISAGHALNGLADNKAVVIVGMWETKFMWLATRLFPNMFIRGTKRVNDSMRKLRVTS